MLLLVCPLAVRAVRKAEAEGLRVLTPAEAAQQADVIMLLIPDQHHREVFEREHSSSSRSWQNVADGPWFQPAFFADCPTCRY